MGDDLKIIKEDIKEIKEGIKEITTDLNNLRVLTASDYVSKTEFLAEAEKNNQFHNNFTNSLILTALTLLTIFGYLFIRELR